MKIQRAINNPVFAVLFLGSLLAVLLVGIASGGLVFVTNLYYFVFSLLVTYLAILLVTLPEYARATQADEDLDLRRLAYQDSLTGLPNRHKFTELLSGRLNSRNAKARKFTVMFIDLDLFKQVNDSYGHDVGDKVLIESARRIAMCLPHKALFSRLGGDEFVVMLEDELSTAASGYLVGTIKNSVAKPMHIDGQAIQIGASVGLTNSGVAGRSVSDILKAADIAMYRDKDTGRLRKSGDLETTMDKDHYATLLAA